MSALEIGNHLVIDPAVCHGKMTFKGTRVPVHTILLFLGKLRKSISYVRKSWPSVSREAIEEALRLAPTGWPELLEDEVAERLQSLLASIQKGKRAAPTYEPVHSGRSA